MLLVAAPEHGAPLLRADEAGAGEGDDIGVEGLHDAGGDFVIQQRIHFGETGSVACGQVVAVVDVFSKVFHPAVPGLVARGVGEHLLPPVDGAGIGEVQITGAHGLKHGTVGKAVDAGDQQFLGYPSLPGGARRGIGEHALA